jgi:hypothetical protein
LTSLPSATRSPRALNRRIRDIGRDEGVEVLPFFATLEDPKAPDRMKAEWRSTATIPRRPAIASSRRSSSGA